MNRVHDSKVQSDLQPRDRSTYGINEKYCCLYFDRRIGFSPKDNKPWNY